MSPTKGLYGLFVKSAADVPQGEHWAILEFSGITIPGDERSRTHPGHGYPERSETTVGYEAFDTEAEMREVLTKRIGTSMYELSRCIGIHVTESFTGRLVTQVQTQTAKR